MGGSSYKTKYHSDPYRSVLYAAYEDLAEYILKLAIASSRTGFGIKRLGVGVGETGIVEGSSSGALDRWDFEIVAGRGESLTTVAYVEATGDFENDGWARILSEKVDKALNADAPVYFLYMKRTHVGTLRRHPRVFYARLVKERHSRVDRWLQGEKPYYYIELKYGATLRSFIKTLKNLYIERIARR